MKILLPSKIKTFKNNYNSFYVLKFKEYKKIKKMFDKNIPFAIEVENKIKIIIIKSIYIELIYPEYKYIFEFMEFKYHVWIKR